jgi:hypothetical protein
MCENAQSPWANVPKLTRAEAAAWKNDPRNRRAALMRYRNRPAAVKSNLPGGKSLRYEGTVEMFGKKPKVVKFDNKEEMAKFIDDLLNR